MNDYELLNMILLSRLLRSDSGAGVVHNKHCQAFHQRCYINALYTLRPDCIKPPVKYAEISNVCLNANRFHNL